MNFNNANVPTFLCSSSCDTKDSKYGYRHCKCVLSVLMEALLIMSAIRQERVILIDVWN